VQQLFAHSGGSTTSVLSVFLLFFSGVSLTRRMQRMYQQAWGLPPATGVGQALNAACGLLVLVVGIGLLYLARTLVGWLPVGDVVTAVSSVLGGFALWTTVPWLLLDRRISWRRLIPAGALAAVCSSIFGVASTLYMPRQLESYSERYGLFGVTLALIGWLVGLGLILVAATAVAAEFDRSEASWARCTRSLLRIQPRVVEVPGADDARPVGAGPRPPSSVGS
jgi:uncharacterized BrkB/YihY/UPF0761 family membrane protein